MTNTTFYGQNSVRWDRMGYEERHMTTAQAKTEQSADGTTMARNRTVITEHYGRGEWVATLLLDGVEVAHAESRTKERAEARLARETQQKGDGELIIAKRVRLMQNREGTLKRIREDKDRDAEILADIEEHLKLLDWLDGKGPKPEKAGG